MDPNARRVHRVTALITLLGALCSILQVIAPFRGLYQFFTTQVVFVAAAITYARALRWRTDPAQHSKAALILRGNIVALVFTLATLVLDTVAKFRLSRPLWTRVAIAVLYLLTLASVAALAAVFRQISPLPPPTDSTMADALDDLWTLIRVPAGWDIGSLFARVQWAHPRRHPWRLACVLGIAAGLLLFLAHLQEGLPPSLRTGLLVAGIFVSIEFVATMLGFAALGGYLGLRPPACR
jgi:hypothetical protein